MLRESISIKRYNNIFCVSARSMVVDPTSFVPSRKTQKTPRTTLAQKTSVSMKHITKLTENSTSPSFDNRIIISKRLKFYNVQHWAIEVGERKEENEFSWKLHNVGSEKRREA